MANKAIKPRKTYFHWGVMDSGKSAELLKDNYNYTKKGWDTILVKPGRDDRNGNWITTDLAATMNREADLVLGREDNVAEAIAELISPTVKAVFVDEIQFVSVEQATDLKIEIAQGMGIPVLTYGLLKDFRNEFFPASELYWNDDEVVKREVRSMCYCGDNAATVNVRRVNGLYVFEGEQIAIEKGPTTYETYCEPCFEALREAIALGEISPYAPAGILCGLEKIDHATSSI